jgi:hypothetical protein
MKEDQIDGTTFRELTTAPEETARERLNRLIDARFAILKGTWRWNHAKCRRMAVRHIVEEELEDLQGAGMATAGPRTIAIIEVLLEECRD